MSKKFLFRRKSKNWFPPILLNAQEMRSIIPSLSEFLINSSKDRELDGYLIVAKQFEIEYLGPEEEWVGKRNGFHVGYVINKRTMKRVSQNNWYRRFLTTDDEPFLYYVNMLAVRELLAKYGYHVEFELPNRIILGDEVTGVVIISSSNKNHILEEIFVVVSVNPPERYGEEGSDKFFNPLDLGDSYKEFPQIINKYYNLLLANFSKHLDGKEMIKLLISSDCRYLNEYVKMELPDGRVVKGLFVGLDSIGGYPIIEKNGRRIVVPLLPKRIIRIET